jgi:hypothetical protein
VLLCSLGDAFSYQSLFVIVQFFAESPILRAIKFLNVGEAWFAKLLGK